MGNIEGLYPMKPRGATGLPFRAAVFADAAALVDLASLAGTIALVEVGAAEPLPAGDVARAEIVVLQVDPRDARSLDRLERLRSSHPSLPIVAALAGIDLGTTRMMLHKGIADVAPLPFVADDLLSTLLEVTASRPRGGQDDVARAPLITLLKSMGGSGSTTLATHLASSLAGLRETGGKSCLIDLDLQSGDVASYLDRDHRLSIADLFEGDERLDDEMLRSVAIEYDAQLDVIPAPLDIMPIEEVSPDKLMRILAIARKRYDFVLIDLPAVLTNWAMSVLLTSSLVLLVGNPQVASLRQIKRKLGLLRSMDVDPAQVGIVLNRVEGGFFKTLDSSNLEAVLGHPILGVIHNDSDLLATAQARGKLASAVQKRSKFKREIDAVAARIDEQLSRCS
jgi:pilus assembly protein CpaE